MKCLFGTPGVLAHRKGGSEGSGQDQNVLIWR